MKQIPKMVLEARRVVVANCKGHSNPEFLPLFLSFFSQHLSWSSPRQWKRSIYCWMSHVLNYFVVYAQVHLQKRVCELCIKCSIFIDILEDPMQVHCPEGNYAIKSASIEANSWLDHMFCSKCIACHVEQQSNCPICTTPLDKNTFQVSKFVTRQVGRLRIKCAYSENGCPWQGLLSDQHISEVINQSINHNGYHDVSMVTNLQCP